MRSFRLHWLTALIVPLLGGIGLVSMRSHRIERAWKQMIDTGRNLEHSYDEAHDHRPILHGESIDGLAYEEYARAESLLSETARYDWIAVEAATAESDGSAIPLRNALVDQNREMLMALELGARHTEAHFPVDWQEGWDAHLPDLIVPRSIANIAVLAAQRFFDEDQPLAGVTVLLDAMQYGRDLMTGPTQSARLTGGAILDIASYQALITRGLLERIPQAALALLAEGMESLESGFPRDETLIGGDIAFFIRTLEDCKTNGLDWNPSGDPLPLTWRYAYSKRLIVAEYVQDSMQLQELVRSNCDRPWPELRKIVEDRIALLAGRGNPVGAPMYGNLLSVLQSERAVLARFNLTRVATEYRISGMVVALDDPFGSELQTTTSGKFLRVASLGPQGEDSNGIYSLEIER